MPSGSNSSRPGPVGAHRPKVDALSAARVRKWLPWRPSDSGEVSRRRRRARQRRQGRGGGRVAVREQPHREEHVGGVHAPVRVVGHPPAAAVVVGDPGEHAVAHVTRGVPEHPARPDDQRDVGQRARPLRRVRGPAVATHRDHGRGRGDLLLGRPLRRGRREVGRVSGDSPRIPDHGVGQRHPLTLARLDHALGGPPHAEVGLDGARVPQRADDLAVDGGVLALRGDHRVDVGRRPADVDDEHVAAHDVGEHLHAAEHGIRRGGAHQLGEPAAAGEPLAADDVGQEGLADGGARRLGRDDPDAGQHVGRDDVPAPGRGQQGRDLVGRLGVAGHDDRCGQPRLGDALGVVQQHVGVAAVGAAHEEHEVGGCRPQRRDVGAGHRAARDVHDLGPGRQADPVPGLGRHLALVADDGQAQPTPGAGADEHLVRLPVRRE